MLATIDVQVMRASDFVRELCLTICILVSRSCRKDPLFSRTGWLSSLFSKVCGKMMAIHHCPRHLGCIQLYGIPPNKASAQNANRILQTAASSINFYFVRTTICFPLAMKDRSVHHWGCTAPIINACAESHASIRVPSAQNRAQVMNAVMRSLQKRMFSNIKFYVEMPHGAEAG